MLNMPQYYHYSEDNEKQLVSTERMFIVLTSAICFSSANITCEVN